MTDLAEPIPETLVTPRRSRPAVVAPALTLAFLLAVAWFAHFSGWRHIGFFSDDHSFAVLTMAWTPADARHLAAVLAFSYPEPQGRPLGFLLGLELPYLGYHWAGVFGMFAVGWIILSGNAALLYGLLARRLPPPLPLVGALMFLLYPADTTRPFLCHAHILQPSITFALVAAHLFLCRSMWARAVGYVVAALCLVTYETAVLPLLAVPLLDWPTFGSAAAGQVRVLRPANGAFPWRRLWIHVATLMALVGVVAVTRARGGEYRAVGATGGKGTVVVEVALGSVLGPLSAIHACLRRPWQQLPAIAHHPQHLAVVAVASAVFGVALQLAARGRQRPTGVDIRRAAVFGGCAVAISYLFCFTHYPPTCEEGQSTSVHVASVVGAAALTASGFGALARLRSQRWAIAAAAVYFGLAFGHSVDEQAAFARLWHERQAFWTQVLDLCPDLSDRTVILCDGTLPQPTWYMPANLWSDAMVPAQVYDFPATFRLPPLLAAFPRIPGQDWRTAVGRDAAGRLVWRTPPCNCPAGQELVEGNTILLRVDNAGHVTRVSGVVGVAGRTFRLKVPSPANGPHFPKLPFYNVLTGRS